MGNENYGKVIRIIRNAKKISLKDLAEETVSIGTLSQFENGNTVIAVDHFFKILETLKVSPEEFQEVYNYYYLEKYSINQFSYDINQAFYNQDIRTLEFQLNRCLLDSPSTKLTKQDNNLLQIIIESYIYQLDASRPVRRNRINTLFDYLMGVEIWGLYEIYLLSSCAPIFDESELKALGNKILPTLFIYSVSPLVYTSALNMLHRMIQASLTQKWTFLSAHFLKYADNLKYTERSLYVKTNFIYDKGWYFLLIGKTEEGFELINKIYDFYTLLDEENIIKGRGNEIDKLRKEFSNDLES